VFLPTYSPDFNSIEPAFSQLKGRLRRAEARTVDAIFAATQDAYPALTTAHARNYYRNAGYKL
jgi:transposase